eukprot:gnl/Spiro4/26017_TR12957_c0_g1_i1.p1 gnl/Spiro4/26017_TR12957_c0_g1~~gnl/Spiro4/26017_TR12957_c0_g1_i1.p1  ORF type:complete len:282 (+),score=46.96 gnl/Spiro4/26017_TR12957_c0_g1_i1:78-923(+)
MALWDEANLHTSLNRFLDIFKNSQPGDACRDLIISGASALVRKLVGVVAKPIPDNDILLCFKVLYVLSTAAPLDSFAPFRDSQFSATLLAIIGRSLRDQNEDLVHGALLVLQVQHSQFGFTGAESFSVEELAKYRDDCVQMMLRVIQVSEEQESIPQAAISVLLLISFHTMLPDPVVSALRTHPAQNLFFEYFIPYFNRTAPCSQEMIYCYELMANLYDARLPVFRGDTQVVVDVLLLNIERTDSHTQHVKSLQRCLRSVAARLLEHPYRLHEINTALSRT